MRCASTSTSSSPPTPARSPSSCASATAQGQEVQKLSQQYLLSGDAKDLEAAKQGEILFYREPDLPPGVYTMESIVFDAIAQQGSARVATLTVPAAEPSAFGDEQPGAGESRRGDVRRRRRQPARRPPLYVGRTLLYPEPRRADPQVGHQRAAVLLHALRRRRDGEGVTRSCCATGRLSPRRRCSCRRRPARASSTSAGCRSALFRPGPTSCGSE